MYATYFEYAARLTEQNIEQIIHFGTKYGWDLDDELRTLHAHCEAGGTCIYVGLVWDVTASRPESFNTFPEHIFDSAWRNIDGVRGPFIRIAHSH